MLLSGRPLLDTLADEAYFVGREAELAAVDRAVEQSLNVLVLGARGVGKSSLLRRAAYRLRQRRHHRVVFVDAAVPGGDPAALLEFIAEQLLGPEEVVVSLEAQLQQLQQGFGRLGNRTEARLPTPAGRLLAVVSNVRSRLAQELSSVSGDENGPWWDPGAPAVVLLDGAAAGVAHALFGQLRDEVWSLPIIWVVSGDEAQRAGYLRPPADAFFDVRLQLTSLSLEEAAELLRTRFDRPPAKKVLRRIVDSTDRSPRALVAAARRHLSDPSSTAEESLRLRAEAQTTLAACGRPAEMLVAELRVLGGAASASDSDLLSALGWSRPRATQVFKQLKEIGLVTASQQRTDGAGRPRTVYELVEDIA